MNSGILYSDVDLGPSVHIGDEVSGNIACVALQEGHYLQAYGYETIYCLKHNKIWIVNPKGVLFNSSFSTSLDLTGDETIKFTIVNPINVVKKEI